jgi:ribonuclease J
MDASIEDIVTPGGRTFYKARNREEFVTAMATSPFATSRKRLANDRAIIMLRDSMVRDFARGGLEFTPQDAYVFSSWSGYLDPDDAGSG